MRSLTATRLLMAAVLIVIVSAAGCGGGSDVPPDTDPDTYIAEELRGAPQWVIKGSGDDADKIYGLGSVTGTRDVGLARNSALNAARQDIALRLRAEVRSLNEVYRASTTGGAEYGSAANDEQHLEEMMAQVGKMDLSGAGMEDMWISATGTMWVLAALDIENLSGQLDKMNQLNERIRQDIVERAREGHGRLWDKTGD
jgi:hypothetical protein